MVVSGVIVPGHFLATEEQVARQQTERQRANYVKYRSRFHLQFMIR